MRVRFTQTALDELREIFAHLEERNPKTAAAATARVEQVVAWIADFPHIGYRLEDDVRFLPLGRYPFSSSIPLVKTK